MGDPKADNEDEEEEDVETAAKHQVAGEDEEDSDEDDEEDDDEVEGEEVEAGEIVEGGEEAGGEVIADGGEDSLPGEGATISARPLMTENSFTAGKLPVDSFSCGTSAGWIP